MDIKTSYINLYNNSLSEYLTHFCKGFNLNNEKVYEDYKYVHTMKISAYMLFVKDTYKNKLDPNNKFKYNSKIISHMWKNITPEEKKPYEVEAKRLKEKYGLIKKPKPKKKRTPAYIVPEPTPINDKKENDFELREITIEGNIYLIDSFDNIITAVDGVGSYVGYNNEGTYIFYK